MKKTNNKGFSRVDLIVLIAIMLVLICVVAPAFAKYAEREKRSTDIQNAEMIKDAMLEDMANGVFPAADTGVTVAGTAGDKATDGQYCPTKIVELPLIKATFAEGTNFTMDFDPVAGTCKVYAAGYELTNPTDVESYKTAKEAKTP